jgi:putative SOS response-associated peptidase YedK
MSRLKSGEPFAFADIELDGKSQRGEDTTAFVVLTTEPNSVVEPVMLTDDDPLAWLDPDTPQSWLPVLLTPYTADKMEA